MNKFLIKLNHFDSRLSWEQKTAFFGAYLIDKGVQSATLKSYFSAIKYMLKQDGYPWDDKKAALSSLVKSCKIENDKVKVRLPIQKGLLEVLLFEIKRKFDQQPYLLSMYTAMFCLGYYGMLRVGEMTYGPHTLKVCNIHVSGNKQKIQIVLYTSKTHGIDSSPQKIKIAAINSVGRKKKWFCPCKMVAHFLFIRGGYIDEMEQFFVFSDKSPVKPCHLRTTLRSLLERINLNSILYDVHSFRNGRACDLEKFRYSLDKIKAMGRWRSNAVFKYLKNY